MGNGFLKAEELIFSELFGGEIYKAADRKIPSPLDCREEQGYSSPLLYHIITGEEYFLKRFDPEILPADRMKRYIMQPPCREHILWPSDMIWFQNREQASACGLFVSRQYREDPTPVEERNGMMALLFRANGFAAMENASVRLSRIRECSWKNPEVRKIVVNILRAVDSINQSGYVYEDIHLSRIFFTGQDEVIFDFSNLVYAFSDLDSEQVCTVLDGMFPLEFADPYIAGGKSRVMDYRAQNYSLCALLFYLFFGQYPYNGRLLEEMTDDDLQHHYAKFRRYHQMPVFLFDPEDASNRPGIFEADNAVQTNWESCPEVLRNVFTAVFREKSARREDDEASSMPPSAREWLSLLEKMTQR